MQFKYRISDGLVEPQIYCLLDKEGDRLMKFNQIMVFLNGYCSSKYIVNFISYMIKGLNAVKSWFTEGLI